MKKNLKPASGLILTALLCKLSGEGGGDVMSVLFVSVLLQSVTISLPAAVISSPPCSCLSSASKTLAPHAGVLWRDVHFPMSKVQLESGAGTVGSGYSALLCFSQLLFSRNIPTEPIYSFSV